MKIETNIDKLRIKSIIACKKDCSKLFEKLKQTQIEIKTAVGVAACQIGIYKRVFYANLHGVEYYVINPVIIKVSKKKSVFNEGCLSLPGSSENPIPISRPKRIKVRYINENGETITAKYDGLIAKVFQHEIDHFNGVLITDY